MIEFLPHPGPRERHLQRKYNNPLFSQSLTPAELAQARHDDQTDLEEFIRQFQTDIDAAVNLPPQADADDILALKTRLEKLYSQACGIQGDSTQFKTALKKLLELITRSLLNAANNDAEAMERIEKDMEAMDLHLQISESLLAADLLHPEQIIPYQELAATLLGSEERDLNIALLLFAPEQLQDIIDQAEQQLAQYTQDSGTLADAQRRLMQMRQWLNGLQSET